MNNFLGKLKNIKAKNILDGLKKASPELLVAGGIFAMGTAVVLAIKNAPKAQDEVEEKKAMFEAEGKEMPKTDTVWTHAKHQVPTIVLFATGTAAIIGANRIQNKRNVALALALEAAEASCGNLEGTIKKLLGKEEEKKSDGDEEAKAYRQTSELMNRSKVQRMRDEFTGIEFEGSIGMVEDAVKEINKHLFEGERMSLSDLYRALRIPEGVTPANGKLGWYTEDKYSGYLLEVEYGTVLDNGEAIIVFEYVQDPTEDFMD